MIDLDLIEFEDVITAMIFNKVDKVLDGDRECSKEEVKEYLSFALTEFFTKAVCVKFPNFMDIPEFQDWFNNQPASSVDVEGNSIRVFTVDDMTPTLKFCFLMAVDSALDDLVEGKTLKLQLSDLNTTMKRVQPVALGFEQTR